MNEDELKTLLLISDMLETYPKEHLATFLLDIATIKNIENGKEIKSLTVEEAEHIQKEFRKNVLQQIANRDILNLPMSMDLKKKILIIYHCVKL